MGLIYGHKTTKMKEFHIGRNPTGMIILILMKLVDIPSDKRLHDFEKRNMLSLCDIASVEKIHFSLNHVMGQKEGRTWKSYKTKVA